MRAAGDALDPNSDQIDPATTPMKGNAGEEELCAEQPSQEDGEATRDQDEPGG